MTARQTIYLYLVVVTALGVLSGLLTHAHPDAGALMGLLWMLLGPVTGYVWFRLDSAERDFQGSPFWGPSIILFTVPALPIYLYKSRAKDRRVKSLAQFAVLVVLSIALPVLAAACFER
ncbi:MAG: hypothetical protein WEK74_10410 [Hydrogenophaga sp.]